MAFGQFDRGGDKVKDSVAEYKELFEYWRAAEPEKVKEFDKKMEQLDDGQHLMSLLKVIIVKMLKK